ncbi:Mitotic spindle-associated MMXD complex subunit MIP18 [Rhizophlyctis rosea]|uniref:Mitotic spindle-associated MMXD complex subunit MIP18 n=1 Tax=Rhizophlyctis rosea TaxID=64517 RepID=A0AAD5WZB1_9FUNG|nr:Mitotic spindle-associated MMXD complex subunit MIP18 [Rhizophlyctis rosea]
MSDLQNANPTIYEVTKKPTRVHRPEDDDEGVADLFDADEVFELIRHINDPEHPLTLEQLNVTQLDKISVDPEASHVTVRFTPTIPHCSMATLIGLCIRVRLLRSLPDRFKVDIMVTEGTHQSEHAVNKQLNDKERVAAALENSHLLEVVNQCLKTTIDK